MLTYCRNGAAWIGTEYVKEFMCDTFEVWQQVEFWRSRKGYCIVQMKEQEAKLVDLAKQSRLLQEVLALQ